MQKDRKLGFLTGTCVERLKVLAGLRFLLLPTPLLDALLAEFFLFRLFVVGCRAGSAANQITGEKRYGQRLSIRQQTNIYNKG